MEHLTVTSHRSVGNSAFASFDPWSHARGQAKQSLCRVDRASDRDGLRPLPVPLWSCSAMHMVACSACHGEGARFTRPSRHALHEHHLAVAAAAAADSEPPQRPPPRRVPCKVCCATGLVQNSAPDTPAPEFGSATVAIVGGGIGGAAAALALQQRGLNAVVYERGTQGVNYYLRSLEAALCVT